MASFLGSELALGWQSVALASHEQKEKPVLSDTVLVEFHRDGVRLVATDSYILLHAWVQSERPDGIDGVAPGLDEAPESSAVVCDPDGRGLGLLAYVGKLAKADKEPHAVRLDIVKGADSQLPGIESRFLTIDHPGHEQVRLACFDGEYPNWRALLAVEPKATRHVALGERTLVPLAKLVKLHRDAGAVVRLTLSGDLGAVRLDVMTQSAVQVEGLVMPVRVDVAGR